MASTRPVGSLGEHHTSHRPPARSMKKRCCKSVAKSHRLRLQKALTLELRLMDRISSKWYDLQSVRIINVESLYTSIRLGNNQKISNGNIIIKIV